MQSDIHLLHGNTVLIIEAKYYSHTTQVQYDKHTLHSNNLYQMHGSQDVGKITAEIAKAKAETEFEKYRVIQDRLFMSDFDKYMLELEENAKK